VNVDQGYKVPIESLDPKRHTIHQQPIVAITKTICTDPHLIRFRAGSLGFHIPSKDVIMSPNHRVHYKGHDFPAEMFAIKKVKGVERVPYHGETLYNVLLEKHSQMTIENMQVETLHPDNEIANYFRNKKEKTSSSRFLR
jgi:hypothetical protein